MRAARRRLFEEVGVAADLTLAFRSRYAVAFENGLSENEIVNVYVGSLTGTPRPHPDEVIAIEMLTIDELAGAVARRPAAYAFWLRHIFATTARRSNRRCGASSPKPAARPPIDRRGIARQRRGPAQAIRSRPPCRARLDERRLAAAQHRVALEERALVDRRRIEPVLLVISPERP